jgi:hypothetical protein
MSRRFFGLLCAHEWEVVDRYEVVGCQSGRQAGIRVELRCKHCGDLKWRGFRV